MARLNAGGDRDYFAGLSRTDNPFPSGTPQRETWFATWDAAAHEAAVILKSSGAAQLYRAALETAALLRDMRDAPRTLTTRMPRYRDVEAALNTALSRAKAPAKSTEST